MGYYTRFKLTTEPKVELKLEDLESMSGGYVWDQNRGGYMIEEQVKWYDFDAHMRAFSKKRGDTKTLFILEGEGEESGDIWQGYYKNGKAIIHQAILTFPKFDEEDLR